MTLGDGEVTAVAPLPGGRTEVLLVRYATGEHAVFKPARDAQRFETETDRELVDAGAELAAYLVSEALGLRVVPETCLGQLGGRPGVLSRFILGARNVSETVTVPQEAPRIPPAIAFLDYVIGNRDRRQANRLLDPGPPPREWAIDHGAAFYPGVGLDAFLRNVLVFDVPVTVAELPPLYQSVLGRPLEEWDTRFASVVTETRARAMLGAARREIDTVLASPVVRAALERPVPRGLFERIAPHVGTTRAREACGRLDRLRDLPADADRRLEPSW